MKLEKTVVVQPPPYSDNTGKVTTPELITLDELDIVYIDDPSEKVLKVEIAKFPQMVNLYAGDAYDKLGDWTKKQADERLKILLGDNPASFLRDLFPETMEENPHGPGTILASMIKTLGIHMSDSCSCRRHAINMNQKGNDWCEQNIDTVVGWLRQEAKRRGLPFVDMVGKVMVKRAIKKSRKLMNNEPVPENDEDLDAE